MPAARPNEMIFEVVPGQEDRAPAGEQTEFCGSMEQTHAPTAGAQSGAAAGGSRNFVAVFHVTG